MFFPRLRRQAKWMFVFLALVFGLGYVIFNVGGTIPGTGIADLFAGAGSSSAGPSVSDAQEKIEKNPNDADAYRELSQALQVEGRTAQAIAPLERYVRLRPNDAEGLQELSSLYTVESDRVRNEYQVAQYAASLATAGSTLAPTLRVGEGQTIGEDPITQAQAAEANERVGALGSELQAVSTKTTRAYKKLTRLTPEDPTVQLQLAQAAEQAGDVPAAVAAYRDFLKLAPDDSSAPLIKQRIKELQSSSLPGQ
ncbi:MAG: tetratricopeptide repeat protein [Actinobacteria bacterium]|nr:tetratricopeptide repeat protein [Actinomycetota bacterium]